MIQQDKAAYLNIVLDTPWGQLHHTTDRMRLTEAMRIVRNMQQAIDHQKPGTLISVAGVEMVRLAEDVR